MDISKLQEMETTEETKKRPRIAREYPLDRATKGEVLNYLLTNFGQNEAIFMGFTKQQLSDLHRAMRGRNLVIEEVVRALEKGASDGQE